MPKGKKTVFFCQSCGYESSKWLGQCPSCKKWNSFVEETVEKSSAKESRLSESVVPLALSEISAKVEDRFSTHSKEFDRVLGGGIVPGSLVLIGGDPGIGKSTLLLQLCRDLSFDKKNILYISGEESLQQIKLRADRMGKFDETLKLLSETNLSIIKGVIEREKPDVVIIDSIQTMYSEDVGSAPGSVSQVRESTNVLMHIAKGLNVTVFVVGHVTKEGTVAGPRVLEHMVDTVLYLEGDRYASYRILRGVKNRFGSTNEIGVFEMRQDGLREVENPSKFMLAGKPKGAAGSVVACSMEGTRPILIEIQALVTKSNFGMPRRATVGTDLNRLNLLIAVLEKRIGIPLGEYDAYVNLAGGLKVTEPAIDLAIVMALVSSFKDKPVDDSIIAFGEVGLSGEIRATSSAEQRIREANKLGFNKCIFPKASDSKDISIIKNENFYAISTVNDVVKLF